MTEYSKAKLLKYYKDLGADLIFETTPVDNTKPQNSIPKTVQDLAKRQEMRENNVPLYNESHITTKPTLKVTATAVVSHASNNSSLDSPARELADKATTLQELEAAVRAFDLCELKKTAINTVFADGTAGAKLMLIGEAPGANEDKEGIPFCGASGKLLNNIMLSIGLKREDLYITNTIFWRPPGNRRPTAQELALCRPFVEKQIALLKPQMIVLVGNTAVEALLNNNISMHAIRSSHYNYTNRYLNEPINTAVIFHPSYLLRQPAKKKLMWEDVLKIKAMLR